MADLGDRQMHTAASKQRGLAALSASEASPEIAQPVNALDPVVPAVFGEIDAVDALLCSLRAGRCLQKLVLRTRWFWQSHLNDNDRPGVRCAFLSGGGTASVRSRGELRLRLHMASPASGTSQAIGVFQRVVAPELIPRLCSVLSLISLPGRQRWKQFLLHLYVDSTRVHMIDDSGLRSGWAEAADASLARHVPFAVLVWRDKLEQARSVLHPWMNSAATGGRRVQIAFARALPMTMCLLHAMIQSAALTYGTLPALRSDSDLAAAVASQWLCDPGLCVLVVTLGRTGGGGVHAALCDRLLPILHTLAALGNADGQQCVVRAMLLPAEGNLAVSGCGRSLQMALQRFPVASTLLQREGSSGCDMPGRTMGLLAVVRGGLLHSASAVRQQAARALPSLVASTAGTDRIALLEQFVAEFVVPRRSLSRKSLDTE